jgi:hypothetical protein
MAISPNSRSIRSATRSSRSSKIYQDPGMKKVHALSVPSFSIAASNDSVFARYQSDGIGSPRSLALARYPASVSICVSARASSGLRLLSWTVATSRPTLHPPSNATAPQRAARLSTGRLSCWRDGRATPYSMKIFFSKRSLRKAGSRINCETRSGGSSRAASSSPAAMSSTPAFCADSLLSPVR